MVNSVMLLWGLVFFLSFQIHAFVIKPSQYAIETVNGNFLPTRSINQELALITSAPWIDRAAVQERADIATCAYVSGNLGMWQCSKAAWLKNLSVTKILMQLCP